MDRWTHEQIDKWTELGLTDCWIEYEQMNKQTAEVVFVLTQVCNPILAQCTLGVTSSVITDSWLYLFVLYYANFKLVYTE